MTYLVLFSTFVWAQDGHRFKGYPTYLRNEHGDAGGESDPTLSRGNHNSSTIENPTAITTMPAQRRPTFSVHIPEDDDVMDLRSMREGVEALTSEVLTSTVQGFEPNGEVDGGSTGIQPVDHSPPTNSTRCIKLNERSANMFVGLLNSTRPARGGLSSHTGSASPRTPTRSHRRPHSKEACQCWAPKKRSTNATRRSRGPRNTLTAAKNKDRSHLPKKRLF